MNGQRPWLGIVAVVLAGLALFVAVGGRFGPGRMVAVAVEPPAAVQAPVAPEAPFGRERFEGGPRFGADAPFASGRYWQHGEFEGWRGHAGFGHGARGFFWPLGLLFGLVNGLIKLLALGMLVWLLVRLWQQRGTPPSAAPTAPTTPAGHDPRVE